MNTDSHSGQGFDNPRAASSPTRVLAEPSFHFARCPSLFTDETGVIRFTRERRQATATDPPLQQGRTGRKGRMGGRGRKG